MAARTTTTRNMNKPGTPEPPGIACLNLSCPRFRSSSKFKLTYAHINEGVGVSSALALTALATGLLLARGFFGGSFLSHLISPFLVMQFELPAALRLHRIGCRSGSDPAQAILRVQMIVVQHRPFDQDRDRSSTKEQSVQFQISIGHAVYREACGHRRAAGSAIDFTDAADRFHGFINAVNKEARHAMIDQLEHR